MDYDKTIKQCVPNSADAERITAVPWEAIAELTADSALQAQVALRAITFEGHIPPRDRWPVMTEHFKKMQAVELRLNTAAMEAAVENPAR